MSVTASVLPETIPSPREGQGTRYLACQNYNECLDVACMAGWEGFRCDECGCDQTHADVIKPVEIMSVGRSGIRKTRRGTEKRCSCCRSFFPATIEYFGPRSKGVMGLSAWCRQCTQANRKKKRDQQKGDDRMKRTAKATVMVVRETENGTQKRCSACEIYFPADEKHFHKDGRGKLGISSKCRTCQPQIKSPAKKTAAKPAAGRDHILVLYFTDQPGLFDWIKKKASEDLREIDMQAMYMLKDMMAREKEGERI